jgi:hypothetical protein
MPNKVFKPVAPALGIKQGKALELLEGFLLQGIA